MEINRTTVETDAGPYEIIEHLDDDGGIGNPLEEFDHEGMELYVYERSGRGWEVIYDNLDSDAGNALKAIISDHGGYGDAEDVERRIRKWLALAGNPVTFVAGYVNTYRGGVYYFTLVSKDWPEPEKASHSVMSEWKAWADGEVYGYVVEGPDGEHVDSCWGFIGDDSREYMLEQARESIEYDASKRLDTANLAGAGFVGII